MFEQYIEDQKIRLQDGIALAAATHNGFTSAALLSKSPHIPNAYRSYFAAEIKRRTYEIRSELLKNPHFSITEAKNAFIEQFEEALQNAAIFSDEELAQIIDDSVKTQINYLCRPRVAIKWFVFGENKELDAQEICNRLDYLYGYDYLIDGARQIIGDCNGVVGKMLLESEFMQAVENIDNDYIFDLTPRQFVDILAPLFDFFSQDVPAGTEKSIPMEALVVFLDDKHIEPIAQELERLYHDENCTEITESIFLKIVTDILDTIDEFEAEDKTVNTVGSLSEIETENIKNTDTKTKNSASVKFISTPGEFATVLALKEFITPECIGEEKPKKFVMKFVAESAQPIDTEDDAPELPANILLGELQESLTELENTAKEAGEEFDKVVESIEAESEAEEYSIDNESEFIYNTDSENYKEEICFSEDDLPDSEVEIEEKDSISNENNYAEIYTESDENNGDMETENIEEKYFSEELLSDDEAMTEEDISVQNIVENNEKNISEIINTDEVISLMLESENLLEKDAEIELSESYIITQDEIIEENGNSAAIDTSNVYSEINTEQFKSLNELEAEQTANFPKISVILGDKRERFIKKLFNKDESIFQKLTAEIDTSPSWKAAAQIYDNFLIDHAISLDNSLAVEFRNMIKSRYAA